MASERGHGVRAGPDAGGHHWHPGPVGSPALTLAEALESHGRSRPRSRPHNEQGIVHRIRSPPTSSSRGWTVKVLDFGLAKTLEPMLAPVADIGSQPTVTSPP